MLQQLKSLEFNNFLKEELNILAKNTNKISFKVFFLYFITIIIVYFFPFKIKDIFFISTLFFFILSRNNVFWITYFLLLIFSPGFLFNFMDKGHELTNFNNGRIIFQDLLVIAFLIKYLYLKVKFGLKKNISLDTEIRIYIIYSLFILFFTFFYENSILTILGSIKYIIYFPLLFILPVLLNELNKFLLVFDTLLKFVIFILFCQLFLLLNNYHFNEFIGGNISSASVLISSDIQGYKIVRPLYSSHLLLSNLFYYIFLHFLNNKHNIIDLKFRMLLAFLSYFSLLISATRGYIIASSILFIFILYLNKGKIIQNLMIFFLFVFIIFNLTTLSYQIFGVIQRLLTIKLLMEGDPTAGDTLIRITTRLPIVMEKFYESPIFGLGYTKEFYLYFDGHVAWATILMNSGIVGAVITFIFILFLILKPLTIYVNSGNQEFLAFFIIFLSFISVQTTTFMVFNFLIGITNSILFIFILSFFIYYKSLHAIINSY
jgi:hypothetical protein